MSVQSYSTENGRYKIFFDPASPAMQYRVDETSGTKAISQDGGKTWQADNTPTGFETLGNFAKGMAPAKTLEDTLATLAKAAPAAIGGPAMSGGFGDSGPFGYNGADSGGVTDLGPVNPNEFGGASDPLEGDVGNVKGPGVDGIKNGVSLTDWLKRAQDVGDSLSAMSAGRAEGRNAEGIANQNQNRAAVDLYNTELSAPSTIARNAVRGDILANAQDVHISHPSTIPDFTITGGMRPSMFSDTTRQLGRDVSSAAARTPIPTPTAPILPPLPQANGFDDTLNIASTISGVSRAVPPEYWGKIASGLKGLFT